MVRNLLKQIRAPDDILSAFKTKSCNYKLHCFPQTGEDVDQRLDRLLKITRDKMLKTRSLRGFLCFNLRSNSCMTRAALTISTDRTADRNHRQRAQANAVRAETT